MIIEADTFVSRIVKDILPIARKTLVEHGIHLPTAILHTMDGVFPILLPFKNDEQKKSLVDYVKDQALQRDAFAVTTVTSARIVDSRTEESTECLVLATSIQGGTTQMMVQHFYRDADSGIIEFGEILEGDDAFLPGQMVIFPDWNSQTPH